MNENIQVVQQGFAEFAKGNIQGILNLLADDVVWTDEGYPHIPYAGRRLGKENVPGFFTGLAESATLLHFEPRAFFADGNDVFVKGYLDGTANATGKAFQSDFCMHWHIENGKVKSYHSFVDTANLANSLKATEPVGKTTAA